MGRAMAIAAALLLAGCATEDSVSTSPAVYDAWTQSQIQKAARYRPTPPASQQMDPNAAAMIWMMYSNQMTDDVMRARQASPAQRYCYQSGGMAWCQ